MLGTSPRTSDLYQTFSLSGQYNEYKCFLGLWLIKKTCRPFLRSGGFPAFSLLRSVPAVSAIRSVPSVQAVPAVSAVRTVSSVQAVPAVPAVSAVRNVPSVQAVPAVSAVRAVPSVQAVPAVSAVPQVQAVPAVQIPSRQDPLTAVSDPTILTLAPRQEELPAKYNFGYSVSDLESGDSKTRQESRDGDVVTGSYTVADPDGRIRTVTYTADSLHGFQAKVTYDGEEGPVAIPFNSPTAAPVQSQSPGLVIARQPTPTAQTVNVDNKASSEVSGEPANNDDYDDYSYDYNDYDNMENVDNNLPQLVNGGARLVPAVSSDPRLVTSVPGLVQVPRVFNTLGGVPALQALLSNNLQTVRGLPHGLQHGVAVRAGAAPLDLSQFTFLSNGQIIG